MERVGKDGDDSGGSSENHVTLETVVGLVGA